MGKVNIVTINDSKNYGNRLQNLAVHFILKQFHFEVTTINYERRCFEKKTYLKLFFHRLTNYKFAKNVDYWRLQLPRELNIESVDRRYLKKCYVETIADVPDADYFVLGSDQVWNPEWYDDFPIKKDLFLLSFVDPAKRVCFAPSFGVDKLPDDWKPIFSKELSKFSSLSVREKAGADIIKELTNREALVMLDPTLMVNANTWRSLYRKPKWLNTKPYILTYFLGEPCGEAVKYLDLLNQNNQYEIYNMMGKEDYVTFSSNYLEFIYLIDHAEIVLTDSFHASVFSFLFNRPFLVFDREGTDKRMNSRLDTFLTMFSLERKYIGSNLENSIFEHEYSAGVEMLEKEKKKSFAYLKEAFGLSSDKLC